ncbi:MAG: winged helix-turn-helix domain-containing protein, partial [Thermoanaerobaculia bacterium]|nr:winged helix-turn-helix domain-containing protein [Thermoanaerobaculia bacterium]
RALRGERHDLLILDVMLPEMDGFAVCRKVRETSRIPIVMLTARGEVTDRVVGLELGADDYLPKPFEPRELVARIQAVLRRGRPEEVGAVRVGELEVSWATRAATLCGRDLGLTGAEFALLALLVRHRGRVLARDRILEETRGLGWEAYDRSIDVLVSRLRQKLGDDARRPRFVRTVRGSGYSFVGDEREG